MTTLLPMPWLTSSVNSGSALLPTLNLPTIFPLPTLVYPPPPTPATGLFILLHLFWTRLLTLFPSWFDTEPVCWSCVHHGHENLKLFKLKNLNQSGSLIIWVVSRSPFWTSLLTFPESWAGPSDLILSVVCHPGIPVAVLLLTDSATAHC